MKTEVTAEQAIGKTLSNMASYSANRYLLLFFTDGTFTTFETGKEYDGDMEIQASTLDRDDGYKPYLVALGIITQEELDAERGRQRMEYLAQDKAMYERLKVQFEGAGQNIE